MINYSFPARVPDEQLTGFNLFNCGATLFKENSVPAVRAPDIDVDLDFLFTPCAFIRACHMQKLSFYLFESPVNRALGNLHCWRLRLVCPTGKLVIALAALPDTGTLPPH
jgi:hypothetical protein